ncbi:bifunctional diguanylate cyclase/phosphodiesterase [Pseudomonas benzenivorans]|uniref:histidine kinase n=1 Tax=Pseudomonas benzenivorans TaxID=556533 RepID=A0ABY5H2U3_9PSED|nr:bifunctional diguanylate cyclase/phosphodiesterase [Pseudomonas benzenivorans]UTW06627.1 PAS domain S-box protein [Pseudomonas benzenivorans]
MRPELVAPLRLAGVYALFGTAWILSGDYLLTLAVTDPKLILSLQSAKGLAFVLLSGLLIFFVSYRERQAHGQLLGVLTRNSRLLQQAQRNAALGSWEYHGRFHWSPEALGLLGRDAGNASSSLEQLLNWLHPADRQAVQRAFQALIAQHKALTISARLHQPHRQQVTWLMLRGEVDGDGQILGTLQDISSQKRDEAALRESEQRFRQLFEQTPRIAVQGYDRERRVVYWNAASTQLYGYSVQEAMGNRLEDLIVPLPARNQVASAINHWLLGGPPTPAAEMQLQRKDGSPVWVYSSRSLRRDSLDRPELYCMDIDISEHKKLDDQLRASEAGYRELVEQLAEVIVKIDAAGHLSFLNPAWERLSGYVGYESLGRQLVRFFESADGTRLAEQLNAVANGGQTGLRGDYRLLTRNGQPRWVDLQLSRRPDGSLSGSLRDNHEHHLKQQLQQARVALLEALFERQPLERVLEDTCRRLQALIPQVRAAIMLQDPQQRLHLAAAPDLPEAYRQAIDGVQAGAEVGSCGHAAYSGELVIAEDLDNHPYWRDYRTEARAAGLRACWSVPFKDDQGRAIGTLAIYYDRPSRPSSGDIALVSGFAQLAGLAVQRSAQQR